MFGPLVVTPLLVDHGAFDAYALLVEAGGRTAPALQRRCANHGPGGGSSTSRLGVCAPRSLRAHDSAVRRSTTRPSRESSETFRKLCRQTTGMMRACYSRQHIDRLVTLCRAAKRAGRVLATAFTTVVEGSPRVCGRCSPPPHHPRRTIRRDQRHPRAPDLSRANGGGWTASRTGDARLDDKGTGAGALSRRSCCCVVDVARLPRGVGRGGDSPSSSWQSLSISRAEGQDSNRDSRIQVRSGAARQPPDRAKSPSTSAIAPLHLRCVKLGEWGERGQPWSLSARSDIWDRSRAVAGFTGRTATNAYRGRGSRCGVDRIRRDIAWRSSRAATILIFRPRLTAPG
jgi:hypothetical protein